MLQSHVIDIGGTFVGVAIVTNTGFRFRAVHIKVEALDDSAWNSLDELDRAARRLFTTGQLSAICAPAAMAPYGAERPPLPASATGATPWMG